MSPGCHGPIWPRWIPLRTDDPKRGDAVAGGWWPHQPGQTSGAQSVAAPLKPAVIGGERHDLCWPTPQTQGPPRGSEAARLALCFLRGIHRMGWCVALCTGDGPTARRTVRPAATSCSVGTSPQLKDGRPFMEPYSPYLLTSWNNAWNDASIGFGDVGLDSIFFHKAIQGDPRHTQRLCRLSNIPTRPCQRRPD